MIFLAKNPFFNSLCWAIKYKNIFLYLNMLFRYNNFLYHVFDHFLPSIVLVYSPLLNFQSWSSNIHFFSVLFSLFFIFLILFSILLYLLTRLNFNFCQKRGNVKASPFCNFLENRLNKFLKISHFPFPLHHFTALHPSHHYTRPGGHWAVQTTHSLGDHPVLVELHSWWASPSGLSSFILLFITRPGMTIQWS